MNFKEWVDTVFVCLISVCSIWAMFEYQKENKLELSDLEKEYNALVDLSDNEELKLKKAALAIQIMKDAYLGIYKDEFLPRAEKMYAEVKQLGDSEKLKALRADLANAMIGCYLTIPTEENATKVEGIYQETKAYLADDKNLRVQTASLAEPLINFYFMMHYATKEQTPYPKNIAKAENIYNEIRSFGSSEEIKYDLAISALPLLRLYNEVKVADQSVVNSTGQIYNENFNFNDDPKIKDLKIAAEQLVKEINESFAAHIPYARPKPPTR